MDKKKHILVISQYFYPEQFRINDMCQEWVKRGYRVTVITGIPNYPQGEFYEGYGIVRRRREFHNGIEIIRLPIVPRGHHSFMLCLNYASFVVSGFIWSMFTKVKADQVFIFEVSPMTQALPGVWYAKKQQVPCFLYVQDLWPENVEIVTGIHNVHILNAIRKMVRYIYKRCTRILATSPSFVDAIIEQGAERERVTYWPQYAEDFYVPEVMDDASRRKKRQFDIYFTGNIGRAQGLDILPKAAELLNDVEVRFHIVGDGRYREEFLQEIRKRNVDDMFVFHGRKMPQEIPGLLKEADAAFVSFMNNSLFEKTIPAKLQSYMACGKPIIASASGETKRIIEEAACGICSPIGDAEALAENIKTIVDMPDLQRMSDNAWEYYLMHFDKKRLMDKMDDYLGGNEDVRG